MSQEDIIFSHVFICVYVVSLITKLFCELNLELETLQNALAVQTIGQGLINPHS